MKFSFKRVHTNELHEIEVIVLPIEIVKAARIPVPKVLASVAKCEQAAIKPEVNLPVAQVIQPHVQRSLVRKRRLVNVASPCVHDGHHHAI